MNITDSLVHQYKETFIELDEYDIRDLMESCQAVWKANKIYHGEPVRGHFVDLEQFVAYRLAEKADRVKRV